MRSGRRMTCRRRADDVPVSVPGACPLTEKHTAKPERSRMRPGLDSGVDKHAHGRARRGAAIGPDHGKEVNP